LISSGAIQIVSGVAVGTVVDSSAIDSVCAGGSASASVISKGGVEDAIGGLVDLTAGSTRHVDLQDPAGGAPRSSRGCSWASPA
jgi:hypothetical protein